MTSLALKGVTVRVPTPGGGERTVLNGINLDVPAGQISVLIGPSGGGKTRLLRLLNRMDDPAEGQILLGDQPLDQLPPAEVRQRVAFVAQKPFLFAETVWQNLCRPFRYRHLPLPERDAPEVLESLSIAGVETNWLDQHAPSLSGGQAQRVCLARALLVKPEVVLLDEPTSALDRPTALQVGQGLRRLVDQGLTLVVVTHDLLLAERLADHLIFLAEGEALETGPPQDLLQQPSHPRLQDFLREPPPIESNLGGAPA